MGASLVVMAAGMGSRFAGGVKQLTPVGPHGEIIMDYSVYDAAEAGFDRVVFVISRRIEEDFRGAVWDRIVPRLAQRGVSAACAFQEIGDVPCPVPEGRVKPWGTGQAVLAAAKELDGPFAVINADDYYGKGSFRRLYDFLTGEREPHTYAMAGFLLGNTLSDYGGVTRGLCVEEDGYLAGLRETRGLRKSGDGAVADGVFYPASTRVSMNMWAFGEEYVPCLRDGFERFLRDTPDPLTGEFLVPEHVGSLVREGRARVKVLETDERWFGMTYREDAEAARLAVSAMTERGEYPDPLFGRG